MLCIVLLILMVLGSLILPLTSQNRELLLYNIKTRTHPFYLCTIAFKLITIGIYYCFVAYCMITHTSYFYITLLYTVYLFAFAPSMFHMIYLVVCFQKGVRDLPVFSKSQPSCQIFLSILIISIFLGCLTMIFDKK